MRGRGCADARRAVAQARELDTLRDLRAAVLRLDGAGAVSDKAWLRRWGEIVTQAKVSVGHFDDARERTEPTS